MGFTTDLLGPEVYADGELVSPRRKAIDFKGVEIVDNPETGRTEITVAPGEGGGGGTSTGSLKDPVYVIATTAIVLSGLQTIDGVSVPANKRVGVLANAGANVGIYRSSTTGWVREADWDVGGTVKSGCTFKVVAGTDYAGATVTVQTADPIVIGTTAVAFRVEPFFESGAADNSKLVQIIGGRAQVSNLKIQNAMGTEGQTLRQRSGVGVWEDGGGAIVQTVQAVNLPAQDRLQVKGAKLRPDSANGRNIADLGYLNLQEWGANGSATLTLTTISGTAGSPNVTVGAAQFEDGDTLEAFEAGASHGLATPAAPTVIVQGTTGATTWDVKLVAVTSEGGYSAASAATTVTTANATLSATNFLQIFPASDVTGAYWYAVYAQRAGSGGYTYRGSFLANPMPTQVANGEAGTVNFLGRSLRIKSNTAPTTPPAGCPSTAPSSAKPNRMRARVLSGGGTTSLVLDRNLVSSVSGTVVGHCIRLALEDAEASVTLSGSDGLELYLPRGTYRLGSIWHLRRGHTLLGASAGRARAGVTTIQLADGAGMLATHAGFAPPWCPGESVRVGDRRMPIDAWAHTTDVVWEVQSISGGAARGTTSPASSLPTFSYTSGNTFIDNDVTWIVRVNSGPTASIAHVTGLRFTTEGTTRPANRVVAFDDYLATISELTQVTGHSVWAAGMAVASGRHILPTLASQNGHVYRYEGSGTSGGSEPTWPLRIGDTVSDNGVTVTCLDQGEAQSGPVLASTCETHWQVAFVGTRHGLFEMGDSFTNGNVNFSLNMIQATSVQGICLFKGREGSQGYYHVLADLCTNWAVQDISLFGNHYRGGVRTGGTSRGWQTRKLNSIQTSMVLDNVYTEGSTQNSVWLPGRWIGGVSGVANEGNCRMLGHRTDTGGVTEEYSYGPFFDGTELYFLASAGIHYLLRNGSNSDGTAGHVRTRWSSTRRAFNVGAKDGSGPIIYRLPQYDGTGALGVPNGIQLGDTYGRVRSVSAMPTVDFARRGDILIWNGSNVYNFIRAERDGALGDVLRANTTAYTIGQIIHDAGSNRLHVCVNAGTSAGSEPAALATAAYDDLTPDGTGGLLWRCVGTTVQDPAWRAFPNLDAASATLPDDNAAIDLANGSVYECATLTANRTKSISTTGAIEGAKIKVRRRTADAFTLDLGGLITLPATTKASAILRYTAGAWALDDTWLDVP